jgi:hypothetical protein
MLFLSLEALAAAAAVTAADLIIARDSATPGRVAYVPVRCAGEWPDVPRVIVLRLDDGAWHVGLAELWRLALGGHDCDVKIPAAGVALP